MSLLREYAITPDVFDVACHSSEEVCRLHFRTLRDVLLSEGLVRDLRDGDWRRLFSAAGRSWHQRGLELVKKLASQGRLIPFPASSTSAPPDDQGWCVEAVAGHARQALTGGVIVTDAVKSSFPTETIVASLDNLEAAPWWSGRSPSAEVQRSLAAYQQHLDAILRCANSIQFIDPHLDPERRGYREFGDILAAAGGRAPAPVIEVHRVCYEGSGPSRRILEPADIESSFRGVLEAAAKAAGVRVEVFVWDDFHDRFVISNLIGVAMQNGFDTTTDAASTTHWARLGRDDRDKVQREFDPASRRHTLRHRFTVG